MKYLQPSFTIYPSVQKGEKHVRGEVKTIDPNHEYTEVGGMCLHCALGKQGCTEKYGKKPR